VEESDSDGAITNEGRDPYGFAKSERENIEGDELATVREIAAGWLEADEERLAHAIEGGVLQEVPYDEEER
jgi:hypothetical protein